MTKDDTFYSDVLKGLQSTPKYLPSKYFYDAKGDALFQEIMDAPEYYLTNADMEIFSQQATKLSEALVSGDEYLDILELGAGDASKSTHLLKSLTEAKKTFKYWPIDISENIISYLDEEMPKRIPGINISGLAGEYLDMIAQSYQLSSNKKLLLFLGSSIGNFEIADATKFLTAVCSMMKTGDLLLIGFDLKKDPHQILAAYNDAAGFTKAFNLNLLERINAELAGDFNVDSFVHFPTYNPITGSCRSYLVSSIQQTVTIGTSKIDFQANEAIDMELSQKFSIATINQMAANSGFNPRPYFFDSKGWYCNAIWEKK